MKSLLKYLNESSVQYTGNTKSNSNYNLLMDNFFCGVEEYSDDEEVDYKGFVKLIKNFVKGIKSMKIESSVAKDYWEDMGVESGLVNQNDAVEDDVKDVADNYDWQAEDIFSLKIEDNVLLMTSDTGYGGGDYYDLKVIVER